MNRPFAYVCSPFAGEVKNNTRKAKAYSRRLYELGYLPIAPHLLFPQFMDDSIHLNYGLQIRSFGSETAARLCSGHTVSLMGRRKRAY